MKYSKNAGGIFQKIEWIISIEYSKNVNGISEFNILGMCMEYPNEIFQEFG